jgi:hypothetical protein
VSANVNEGSTYRELNLIQFSCNTIIQCLCTINFSTLEVEIIGSECGLLNSSSYLEVRAPSFLNNPRYVPHQGDAGFSSMYVFMYVCMYVRVCAYVRMYACMCVCMYVSNVCMHTYIKVYVYISGVNNVFKILGTASRRPRVTRSNFHTKGP